MAQDRNLQHLYLPFREKYTRVLMSLQDFLDVHHPGLKCVMIEGFRSAAYQGELYAQGRTKPGHIVTNADGIHTLSKHQSACAGDVGIFKGHEYIEEPAEDINRYYGHLLRSEGLEWGGDWHSIVDKPHGQIPASDLNTYKNARVWLGQQPWAKP